MKKNCCGILNWKWIKENFWNVVLIWLIWQLIIALVWTIFVQLR